MNTPLRWGILSTAHIGEKLLAGAAGSARTDVVAVGSRDADTAAEFARRWAIPSSYGTYEELLADPDVEAVYIPLPNGMHHEWTMLALAAGKHVLCEKPYSPRPAQVSAAFDRAAERGLVLSEAFMYRYNPQIVEAARLVADGRLGEVRLVRASFSHPSATAGNIRLDPALGGGSMLDVGVYPLSAARLFCGEPHVVTAQQLLGRSGVDVTFVATLEFPRGALAAFDCGFELPDRSALEVVGTTASLVVADPWHCQEPRLTLTARGSEPVDLRVDVANSYQLELEEFAKAVRGQDNALLGRADALGQAVAVDALFRSATSGQRESVA
jgi:D-xylose 1-dehydrogenase (NADP+, D-xylono-1,5-lactone-forming)